MENQKKEVPKVDFLIGKDLETYNLTKEQAMERLKSTINPKTGKSLTDSEQMLVKWCRDGEIDAVRIVKGSPKDRGLHISANSLEAFILTKTGKVEDLLEELMKLKAENKALKQEIKELKASGIQKPRKTKIVITECSLDGDVFTFKLNRSKHQATFKGDEIIKIEKNTRKGFEDITEQVDNEKRDAITEAKKKM